MIPPANFDSVAPVVTLLSPSLSAPFLPEQLITLRVDDENEIANCFVWAEYPDGSSEIIYRDGAFRPLFATRSSAAFQDPLHRQLLIVVGRGDGLTPGKGWPLSPDLYAAPVDKGGNVS
ncbi:MAG TPA: hypothetical protein VK524_34455 [Polyangiaceae bacterium]|nr:hypothetical protein [Polyangiaceae bacterium]